MIRAVQVLLVGVFAVQAAAAQVDDRPRLRRAGERVTTTLQAQDGAITNADAVARRTTQRALGTRLDRLPDTGVVQLPNRRLGTRVLGRQDTRLSSRIEGGRVGDAQATDGSRVAVPVKRRAYGTTSQPVPRP